jgi:hypothetical protein
MHAVRRCFNRDCCCPCLIIKHTTIFYFSPEATSLEYTRLSVPQDKLFRCIGGWICTKCCENKCCSYLRNIKTGSNCFFVAANTIFLSFIYLLKKKITHIYNKVPVVLHYRYAACYVFAPVNLFEQGRKKVRSGRLQLGRLFIPLPMATTPHTVDIKFKEDNGHQEIFVLLPVLSHNTISIFFGGKTALLIK